MKKISKYNIQGDIQRFLVRVGQLELMGMTELGPLIPNGSTLSNLITTHGLGSNVFIKCKSLMQREIH